jgi:hypothetical protein
MTDDSIYSFGQVQPYDRLVAMPELDALGERLQALLPTFFCRVDGVLHFKLSIDVHYTLNLLTEDIGTRVKPPESTWWDGAQSVEVDGKSITTLSDETLSWVLLHRLYVDCVLLNDLSIKGLGHVKLLHKYGRLDVQHVLETAHRYPYIGPSILYALRAANLICGLGIKDTIDMPAIRATKAPLMNAGDCLPAFLDFGLSVELNEAKPLEGEIVIQTF